jgi:benzoyl-CoA reductase/2-hydroxyglutaryl-CoA dehydratase subunit BcrC/BadD/HgdB
MTGQDALRRLRAAYDERLSEARTRKATGARLIGYCLNSVPVEVILAAGADPIRLVGDPARSIAVADRYMENYVDGEVRALFAALVEGDFAMLDLFVVPRSSEIYLQLYYFLREVPKWEPGATLPPLHLFDLLQTPHWTSAKYDLGRMRALGERLGGVNDDTLRAGIETTNRVRALLTAACSLWQGRPRRLSGVDALKVIGGASVLTALEAIATLEALVADPPPPLPDTVPRLLLKGSPQSDIRVTALIEECGASVVAHDHVAGDRIYTTQVSTEGNPWEALVQHYQREIPGPRAYPQAREDAAFVALAEAAHVDGVIFFHDEWDDTLGWEYPDQKAMLAARGIPSLFMKRQPYHAPPVAEQRAAVMAFLDTLSKVPA